MTNTHTSPAQITDDAYEAFLALDDVHFVGHTEKRDNTSSETKDFLNSERQAAEQRRADREAQAAREAEEDAQDNEYEDLVSLSDFGDMDDSFIFEDEDLFNEESPQNDEEEEYSEEDTGEAQDSVSEEPDDEYENFSLNEDSVIDLPNGGQITGAELSELLEDEAAFKAREQSLIEKEQALEDRLNRMSDMLRVSEAEVFQELQGYDGVDWEYLYATDRAEWAEHKRRYDSLIQRANTIQASLNEQEAKRQREADMKFKADAKACVEILEKTIPAWSESLYQKLMGFAVKHLSYPEEEIVKVIRPHEITAIYNAMLRYEGKEALKGRVKRASRPSKVVNGGSMTAAGNEADSAKRREIARKYANNTLSNEDVFAYLED